MKYNKVWVDNRMTCAILSRENVESESMRGLLRISVLCVIFSIPVSSFAVTGELAQHLCKSAFDFFEWVPVDDRQAEQIATELLARSGFHFVPVICAGKGGKQSLAGSKRVVYNTVPYYVIGFNSAFRQTIGVYLRGVVAHEVGHMIFPDGACTGQPLQETIDCELAVDREGERLAGIGEVARSHGVTIRYIEATFSQEEFHKDVVLQMMRARRKALLAEPMR